MSNGTVPAVFERPADVKPKAVCWGCQKEEPDGHRFDKVCSLCHEEGFIPAVYCSKKCYKNAWPRHKQWHQEKGPELMNQCVALKLEVPEKTPEESSDPYQVLLDSADIKRKAGDIAGAKKCLRKAQKLNPKRPEAFSSMAAMFGFSGRDPESISCLKESCWRWASLGLEAFKILI